MSALTFEQALAAKCDIERLSRDASDRLRALSGGGPMGLTPDDVRASPEWRAAKADFDEAFSVERAFNQAFLRAFGRQYREMRRKGLAVHHVDGDPRNNDLANLRLVPIKERAR